MLIRMFKSAGKLVLLLVVALTTLGFLTAGLDEAEPLRRLATSSLTPGEAQVSPASRRQPAQADSESEVSESLRLAESELPEPSPPSSLTTPGKAALDEQTGAQLPADLQALEAQLDRVLQEQWKAAGLQSADRADWLTICRRISLSLVGSGLSLEEIRRLQLIPETQRVQRHLESLLQDPRFHDYWAERYARMLVGSDDGPFIAFRRRRFTQWLSDQFAANTRYDSIVRKLIDAGGLSTDRPEVNFFTVTFDSNEQGQPDPVKLAARTSRAFLGLRIDCLQCHDDFLGNVSLGNVVVDSDSSDELREGKQSDFHSLAAFFASARFNGLQGVREESRTYRFQFLNSDSEEEVPPAVPFAQDLLPAEGTPRQRLASWLTNPNNPQTARAAVNRVWSLMFGKSLSQAVDDVPLSEPPHPLMQVLAKDFVDHGYDLRRLIRAIALSTPFQLDSRAEFEVTQRHEQAWSVFPLTRLRPEQVAGCVLQAARVKTVDRDSSLVVQLMKFGNGNDFVTRFGDVGEDEFDLDHVTITQRLIMLNGQVVDENSKPNPIFNASSHIQMFCGDDRAAVDAVYLSVLNRFPDAEERERFVQRLGDADKREAAISDLFWVLVNSSEMAWNH